MRIGAAECVNSNSGKSANFLIFESCNCCLDCIIWISANHLFLNFWVNGELNPTLFQG